MSEATTPSFDPLSEARANASGERARYYNAMGHADEYQDEAEFRQANADFAAYLESRPYKDTAGRAHEAETGKFLPVSESEDDYYDRLASHDRSENEISAPYVSIRELAQEIHALDASNNEADKARQKSLEGTLINRLDDLSEKYGWSKEVADQHVDFLFRKIYNRDEAEMTDDLELDEDYLEKSLITAGNEEGSEPEELALDDDYIEEPKSAAGSPINPSDELDDDYITESKPRNKDLVAELDNDYIGDKQSNPANELDTDYINDEALASDEALDTDYIEDTEQPHQPSGRLAQAKQKLQDSLGNPMLRLAAWAEARRAVGNEKGRRHARSMAIGAAALTAAMVGTKIWLSYKGHQMDGQGMLAEAPANTVAEPNFDVTPDNNVLLPETSNVSPSGSSGSGDSHELLSPSEAYNVRSSEGWYQTLKEMGVPKSQWQDVLQDAGPKLEKQGWAYFDKTHGEWRISQQGKLPESVMTTLKNASAKHGYRLAS